MDLLKYFWELLMNFIKKAMFDKTFTKQKFLSLKKTQQHKKISTILKEIYQNLLNKKDISNLLDYYQKLCSYLKIDPITKIDLQVVSEKYHFHLNKANISLKEHNLLPNVKKEDGTSRVRDFLPIAIYLDNLRSSFNVGSIIRTTEALRIGSIYFGGTTPFVDNEKVKKTSMGAYKHTNCFKEVKLEDLPRPFIGLDTFEKATPIYDFIFPEKFTLILGNEEMGISDSMIEELDHFIEIPMFGYKNSINVASAFAITSAFITKNYFNL